MINHHWSHDHTNHLCACVPGVFYYPRHRDGTIMRFVHTSLCVYMCVYMRVCLCVCLHSSLHACVCMCPPSHLISSPDPKSYLLYTNCQCKARTHQPVWIGFGEFYVTVVRAWFTVRCGGDVLTCVNVTWRWWQFDICDGGESLTWLNVMWQWRGFDFGECHVTYIFREPLMQTHFEFIEQRDPYICPMAL